ncbi:MAG: hypothetical protein IT372_39670 [Polyangiaceae bacterium]|nr:hypothetical protein [Polyangiaceae bacterium]
MHRLSWLARSLFLAAAAAAATGCTPEIGDECQTSTDCSQQGDRLCDTNQPGGYCTIFNCEPDTCPEDDGVCVAFDPELDLACGIVDDGRWARFERTFCLHECEDDGDCRSGYECVAPETRGALIVDTEPLEPKVCMVKSAAPAAPPDTAPGVCGQSGQCTKDGGACSLGYECCSLLCGGGVCGQCKSQGEGCAAPSECCSGQCTDSVCGEPGGSGGGGSAP